jgi:hypothetical protein
MSERPGLHVFPGHGRPVSIKIIDLLRRLFCKYKAERQHNDRQQKIAAKHEDPKTHK